MMNDGVIEPVVEGPRAQVLVVDDYAPVREMLGYLLSCHGYDAHMARDAREAQSLCHAVRFDLLILDVNLRGISGVELCHQLRATWQREVPVLFMSGGVGSLQAMAGQVPRSRFFPKPLQLGDFLQAARELLSEAPVVRE